MGQMKNYLMAKTRELAQILKLPEQDFYIDCTLADMARNYAEYKLHEEADESERNSRINERIKKAIITKLDEAVELIQDLLEECEGDTAGDCGSCDYSFLCGKSSQYKL